MDFMATDRTIIRRMVPEDTESFLRFVEKKENYERHYRESVTKEEFDEWMSKLSNQHGSFTVLDRQTQEPKGFILLIQHGSPSLRSYRITLWFDLVDYQDGVVLETASRMLQYAFETTSAHRVFATCDFRDTYLTETYQNLHMRKEGTMVKYHPYLDPISQKWMWRDTLNYAILQEEWIKLEMEG